MAPPDPSLSLGLSLNPENDPDLAAVVTAWPHLPGDVRKMIAGVVKATMDEAEVTPPSA